MGVFIAIVFIAAVAFLVSRLRPGTRDDAEWYERDSESEALPRLGVTRIPAAGWTVVRSSLRAPEAAVAQSLLESNGIRAVLESSSHVAKLTQAYPVGAGEFRLAVPDEQAEAAEALLAEPS